MAQWEQVIGENTIWGGVIEPIVGIAETLQSILDPIQTILDILQSILAIIRVFLIDFASILLALVQTLVDQITAFLDSLANAALFILVIGPETGSTSDFINSLKGGFDGFVNKLVASLDDTSDPERPLFETDTVGGVALVASSGNILQVLTLLSLIFRAFKNLFQALYVAPQIQGHSGNQTAVVSFSKPSIPQDMFANVTFILGRSTKRGGFIPKSPIDITANVGPEAKQVKAGKKPFDVVRDDQTNEVRREYEFIGKVSNTNLINAAQDYVFVDGADKATPNLVKFNLSEQANAKALIGTTTGAAAFASNTGPSRFELSAVPNAFSSIQASKSADLFDIRSDPEFESHFINTSNGNPLWIDVRINDVSVPNNPDLQTISNPISVAEGEFFVQSFDGFTITLNKNVPLGAKIEAFIYIQAKASELILNKNLNAGHPSVYTSVNQFDSNPPENEKAHFYRIFVFGEDFAPESTENKVEIKDNPEFPISLGDVIDPTKALSMSNEVKIIPNFARAPIPPPAFCISGKQGPFKFVTGKNTFIFTVGKKEYKVNLRPSIRNIFSTNEIDFQNKFGLILDPSLSFAGGAGALGLNITGTLQESALNLVTGQNGLNLDFTGIDGQRNIILPGDLIPIDLGDHLLDLITQTNDKNVRFSIRNNRIIIQDVGSKGSSQIIIGNGTANEVLGFTSGSCMVTGFSEAPDWNRLALKDIVPQILSLGELINSIANALLSSVESGVKSLVDFIDLVSAKIKTIQDFLTQIDKILQQLTDLKIALPNLFILRIPAVAGTKNLKSEIQNATGRPLSSSEDLAAGIVIISGGFGSDVIIPLLHLLL